MCVAPFHEHHVRELRLYDVSDVCCRANLPFASPRNRCRGVRTCWSPKVRLSCNVQARARADNVNDRDSLFEYMRSTRRGAHASPSCAFREEIRSEIRWKNSLQRTYRGPLFQLKLFQATPTAATQHSRAGHAFYAALAPCGGWHADPDAAGAARALTGGPALTALRSRSLDVDRRSARHYNTTVDRTAGALVS